MFKIGLEGMEFFGYHGVYLEEQKNGNNFIVDVYVDYDSFEGSDELDATFDYAIIYEACEKFFAMKFKLLESIAVKIANEIKLKAPEVINVNVRIAKLNPPLSGKVEKSVVEYRLNKS